MTRAAAIYLGVILFQLFAGPTAAHAQPAAGQAATAAPARAPEGLASPRATFKTFLVATVAAADEAADVHLDEAAACLDLSGLSAAGRAENGRELAIKLKEVIDRIRFVEYGDLPDDPDGPPYVFHRDASTGLAITVTRGDDGAWRFDRATVDAIEPLYRALEGSAKVEGVAGSAASLSPSLWLRSKMPAGLKKVGLLMEHWQWLALVVLVVLGVLLAKLVRWLLIRPANGWLRKRELFVPPELVVSSLRPIGLIVMAVLWVAGLRWVGLSPGLNGFFVVIVKFLAAFGFVWFFFRIIDVIAHVLAKRADVTEGRFDDLLVPLFRKSAKIVIVAIGVVFIADVMGISPASLLAGLGLGGLAVALAAQDTVKNFFGSLTVLLDRPFEVGDAVNIGGNTEGVVEEVGFRSTRIRTYENTLITLPNSNLISAKVDNLGRRTYRRFKTTLGVTCDTPPDKVRAFVEGVRELLRRHPLTKKDAIVVYLDGLGAASLDVLVVTHFLTPASRPAAEAKHELLLDIITLAEHLGVQFASPTQTVIVHDGGDVPGYAKSAIPSADDIDEHYRLGREQATKLLEARPRPEPTQEPQA
ncbi:MAG: hypothetical protein CSA66_06625 [Proteobacteria bacterium]|nr:MAG: hypothetical protein CSA66_06625 [Pseudomonadota bacterium]